MFAVLFRWLVACYVLSPVNYLYFDNSAKAAGCRVHLAVHVIHLHVNLERALHVTKMPPNLAMVT